MRVFFIETQEFSQQTGLSTKTIRYYESIGILPPSPRAPNGYREYGEQHLERARFVAGARSLELSLDEISELLAMQNHREAPCRTMLNQIKHKAEQINKRILLLQKMEKDLRKLYKLGLTFPIDDVDGKNCICHLVKEYPAVNVEG